MVDIKITVLKTLDPKEMFGEEFPFKEPAAVCPYFQEGQEMIVENLKRPDDFNCTWAWHDIYEHLRFLYFGGVYAPVDPNVAVTCCSDGKRPVIFKLERLTAD